MNYKRRLVVVVVITAFFATACTVQNDMELIAENTNYIVWEDPIFASGMEEMLGKENITTEEVAQIQELYVYGDTFFTTEQKDEDFGVEYRLQNLEDLQYFTSLKLLDINYGDFNSLEEAGFSLTSLKTLELTACELRDVSGIEKLTELTHLNLDENRLLDVTPISSLRNLTYLNLAGNETFFDTSYEIEGFAELANLTNLEYFAVSGSGLPMMEDVSLLSEMRGLRELYLYDAGIKELTGIADLENLVYLNLRANDVCDLQPLEGMKDLEYLNLRENGVSDLTPLEHCTSLKILNLLATKVEDVQPLADLENLKQLDVSKVDISVLDEMEDLQIFDFENRGNVAYHYVLDQQDETPTN